MLQHDATPPWARGACSLFRWMYSRRPARLHYPTWIMHSVRYPTCLLHGCG